MTTYLLKVICCSGLLLLAYRLFFEREQMLRFNRFYLLFAIVFSCFAPLITIQKVGPTNLVEEIMVSMDSETIGHSKTPVVFKKSESGLSNLLFAAYAVITIALCFRFGRNLWVLLRSIRANRKVKFENANVILLDHATTPYSFFNFLFVSKEDFDQGKIAQQILRHELTHVNQMHSIDIVCVEFILIFGWINPILFLYRNSIQLNHEFLADEHAANSGNIHEYQLLLVSEPLHERKLRLASSFYYSFTKKRLIMLAKKTSPLVAIVKKFAAVSLFIVGIFMFGERAVASQAKKEGKSVVTLFSVNSKTTIELSGMEKKRIRNTFDKSSSLPFPNFSPTQAQLDLFLDANVYEVSINGRKIDNAELKKYSAKNFEDVVINPLRKNSGNKQLILVNLTKRDGC